MRLDTQHKVLKLDLGGIPEGWVSTREAAEIIATNSIAWSLGDIIEKFHGGKNRFSGKLSYIEIPSIIAVNGTSNIYLPDLPIGLTREKLFQRDRNMCAYCGIVLPNRLLEAEHIIPKSKGGLWTWCNIVASCKHCNQVKKQNRTPEEAGMTLLYLPYKPTHWEGILMEGRNIKADQMEFLISSIPKHSRLLKNI